MIIVPSLTPVLVSMSGIVANGTDFTQFTLSCSRQNRGHQDSLLQSQKSYLHTRKTGQRRKGKKESKKTKLKCGDEGSDQLDDTLPFAIIVLIKAVQYWCI